RVGEAVIAPAAMEARIARHFALSEALEIRLEGALYPEHDILQDLAVDFAIFGHRLLDARQLGLLLIVGDGDTAHPPGFAPLAHPGVVDMAAERQHMVKQPLLFGSGLELVFVGFADARLFQSRPYTTILPDRCKSGNHWYCRRSCERPVLHPPG